MNQRTKRADVKYIVIGIISFLFYVLWYFVDGVIQTPDAETYINMDTIREPGYCAYLAFFRVVFGEAASLDAAVIVQCVIAAVAAAVLCRELQRQFRLLDGQMLVILAVQYGLVLLNRFVAQRRYSYFNSIETEGLTYSLWILMFVSLLRIMYDTKKRDIAQALFWCIILLSIRKQMMISFGLFFVVLVYAGWKDQKRKQGILGAVVLVVLGLGLTQLIDCAYNYGTRGVFAPHTGNSLFILGTEIYTADMDMAERIEQEEYRELFLEIMEKADQEQYNIRYAGDGWRNIERHYSNSYDRIKFDVIGVVLNKYLDGEGLVSTQREIVEDEIITSLMKSLLPECIPGMLRITWGNVLHGFITTVLKVHSLLNIVAAGLYLFYIGVLVFLARRRFRQGLPESAVPFAVLVLIAIVANVLLTAATIYSQMRYMLYNTGLFYQALFIMLVEIYRLREGRG